MPFISTKPYSSEDNRTSDGSSTSGLESGYGPEEIDESVNSSRDATEDTSVAICGMALRLPGGVRSPQQLWEFLIAGGDARSRVPDSRYNVDAFHDPSGKPGSVASEYGYFLDEELGYLDTSFFSMPRTEVERMDPQQRLLLEVTRECLEDAGEIDWRGKRIGCFVGSLGEDWGEMFARETQNWGPYRTSGPSDFALSNRVSYEFDLQGPSVTTRTACSASLVALHDACVAISRQDCDSAIVGGTNLILTPGMTMNMTAQNMLSKDGSCKTFSANADGYARGEAVATLYIKRLDQARKDGNPIRAVIRGTSVNHDGKTPGFTVPSRSAQEALIKAAYHAAGIDEANISQTAFVECHGTGTAVGDPIETNAIARVFGGPGAYIGSIKPNIGHTEGASGVVSVIKAVLALENRMIPPNTKSLPLNPAIPFEKLSLTVPTEPIPWPQDRLERVSVNSFGIGGTNAHTVLDSARNWDVQRPPLMPRESDRPQVLLFSANSSSALQRIVESYRHILPQMPDRVQDIAFTLANHREHLPHRCFAITRHADLQVVSPALKSSKPPTVIMVFTGQGAQWPQMGRDLLGANLTFTHSIRSLDKFLQARVASGWSIETEIRRPPRKSRINAAEFAQPICTAVQIALVDALKAIGIQPDGVVGHSSGEIAASYAAGASTAEQAMLNAYYRGVITARQNRAGAMAAIGMSREETTPFIQALSVVIACENSPQSVTISGDTDQVDMVVQKIQELQPNVVARKLQVDKAYHSYHMAEVGEDYESMLKEANCDAIPRKPFFSSVTSNVFEASFSPQYWRQNLESCVLFNGAVSSILEHPVGEDPVFFEIGPHSTLAGPLRQLSKAPYVSAMSRLKSSLESLLSAVGKLYSLQVPLNLSALFPSGSCLSDLPRYPWDHQQRFWFETRLSKDYRRLKYPYHDLLGARTAESTDLEPSWRNLLHLGTTPWIRDHKVESDIIFPFAAYIAMGGEAIRQTTGVDQVFHLRHVIVNTALVIPEDNPTELITNLRPLRLTDSLNSKWWEFTISSHNGHTWIKHCSGEAAATIGDSSQQPASIPPSLARPVNVPRWWRTLRQAGLDLGPEFRNLEEISAGTIDRRATGKLINRQDSDVSKYHFHPAVLDGALQLAGIAFACGQPCKIRNRLPISCEEITIWRNASNVTLNATAKWTGGTVTSEACGIVDGATVLNISGLKLSSVDRSDESGMADTHAAARLEWAPDVDFSDVAELLKPTIDRSLYPSALDRMFQLCLIHSHRTLANVTTERVHLQQFSQWVHDQYNELDALRDTDTGGATILEDINKMAVTMKETPAGPIAQALLGICSNVNRLYSGQANSWEDLLDSNIIDDFHQALDQFDISAFIQQLAHSKSNLRVLEIGSWRTRPSYSTLEHLKRPNGGFMCAKYTFTSKGFLPPITSSERENLPMLQYATFDIDQPPSEQGFEGERYDLILSRDALHQSRSIRTSLKSLQALLDPKGYLLLQDICPTSKWVNYVLGAQPSWWCGLQDNRLSEPYVDMQRLQRDLRAVGFEPGRIILDSIEPFQQSGALIARPQISLSPNRRVHVLLVQGQEVPTSIRRELEAAGYEILTTDMSSAPPPGEDMLALMDTDTPFFEAMSSDRFSAFKIFLEKLDGSGILWVTRPAQMNCQDPRYAQCLGVARTIRSELLIDFATCEVDDLDSSAAQLVRLFSKFQLREMDATLNPDFEYCIINNTIHVGRYYPFAMADDLSIPEEGTHATLDIQVPERPSTLHWARTLVLPPEPAEVRVKVASIGLNFRDVLVATSTTQLPDGPKFGLECAGIVREVGSTVEKFRVGDRVALIRTGVFSTEVNAPESNCIKIPDWMSFDEAATMFLPYFTVIQALQMVGGLTKGQSILVHSGCGGVGLAAIQLAQALGATVYATVGTEQKVAHLVDSVQLPRDHIFSSRDDSFVQDLMQKTLGEGVDLVLNSLSGDLLHATWKCIAPFGKMIEIGKTDIMGAGRLDMRPFLQNRSFHCVDVDPVLANPARSYSVFKMMTDYLQSGFIRPIQPITVFDATIPYHAFRYMQPGKHIGRICVSLQQSLESGALNRAIVNHPSRLRLDGSASYLLVGGLGGIGKSVSRWMVDHGARDLVYLSRNAGLGSSDELFKRELNSMGCEVHFIRGSIGDEADVAGCLQSIERPLKGIVQLSMILRDESFLAMTLEQWDDVVRPKVLGTWNLHRASIHLDLDFLVLFSSLSGIIGQLGQANYASANTFLDAFAQYRTNLGLAASVIDVGAVGDVGYLAGKPSLMQNMAASGFKEVREQEVLDALERAMIGKTTSERQQNTHDLRWVFPGGFLLGLGSSVPLDNPSCRTVWKKDRRMVWYHNTSERQVNGAASGTNLASYIAKAKTEPATLQTPEAAEFFANQIGGKLFALLLKPDEPLNISMSLSDLGMDSLIGTELRSWWKQGFGFNISVLEMLGKGTLEALGQYAAEQLMIRMTEEGARLIRGDCGRERPSADKDRESILDDLYI